MSWILPGGVGWSVGMSSVQITIAPDSSHSKLFMFLQLAVFFNSAFPFIQEVYKYLASCCRFSSFVSVSIDARNQVSPGKQVPPHSYHCCLVAFFCGSECRSVMLRDIVTFVNLFFRRCFESFRTREWNLCASLSCPTETTRPFYLQNLCQ